MDSCNFFFYLSLSLSFNTCHTIRTAVSVSWIRKKNYKFIWQNSQYKHRFCYFSHFHLFIYFFSSIWMWLIWFDLILISENDDNTDIIREKKSISKFNVYVFRYLCLFFGIIKHNPKIWLIQLEKKNKHKFFENILVLGIVSHRPKIFTFFRLVIQSSNIQFNSFH